MPTYDYQCNRCKIVVEVLHDSKYCDIIDKAFTLPYPESYQFLIKNLPYEVVESIVCDPADCLVSEQNSSGCVFQRVWLTAPKIATFSSLSTEDKQQMLLKRSKEHFEKRDKEGKMTRWRETFGKDYN